MVERSDIWLLFFWFVASFASMAAIYLALRAFGFERLTLFPATFRMWAAWLVSYLTVPVGLIVAEKLRLGSVSGFGSLVVVLLFTGFLIGTLAMAGIYRSFRQQPDSLELGVELLREPFSVAIQHAALINLLAWSVVVIAIFISGLAVNTFERYYPEKTDGVYDIS